MKLFACEKAEMEISREEEDKTIRQDEVIVGERIELHSLGLSALCSPGLQVRHRWGISWRCARLPTFILPVVAHNAPDETGKTIWGRTTQLSLSLFTLSWFSALTHLLLSSELKAHSALTFNRSYLPVNLSSSTWHIGSQLSWFYRLLVVTWLSLPVQDPGLGIKFQLESLQIYSYVKPPVSPGAYLPADWISTYTYRQTN